MHGDLCVSEYRLERIAPDPAVCQNNEAQAMAVEIQELRRLLELLGNRFADTPGLDKAAVILEAECAAAYAEMDRRLEAGE